MRTKSVVYKYGEHSPTEARRTVMITERERNRSRGEVMSQERGRLNWKSSKHAVVPKQKPLNGVERVSKKVIKEPDEDVLT